MGFETKKKDTLHDFPNMSTWNIRVLTVAKRLPIAILITTVGTNGTTSRIRFALDNASLSMKGAIEVV